VVSKLCLQGQNQAIIPKDELIPGSRRLRVSCEAKAVGGDRTLRFVIRNPATGSIPAEDRITVRSNEWARFQLFLASRAQPGLRAKDNRRRSLVRSQQRADSKCCPCPTKLTRPASAPVKVPGGWARKVPCSSGPPAPGVRLVSSQGQKPSKTSEVQQRNGVVLTH
jgi:hypothetical protein